MRARTMRAIPARWRNVDAAAAARLADTDFPAFCWLVTAEATAAVRPEVSEMLRSDDWVRTWCDALRWAIDSLTTQADYLRYQGDQEQLKFTRRRINDLSARLRFAKDCVTPVAEEPQNLDPRAKACSWLLKAVAADRSQWHLRACAAAGVDPTDLSEPIGDQVVPWAVERGLLNLDVPMPVRALLDTSDDLFDKLVRDDVHKPSDRLEHLRHPLVVERWGVALRRVRAATLTYAGLPVGGNGVPALPAGAFDWPEDEFEFAAAARRFVAAVQQRQAEHRRLYVDVRQVITSRRLASPEVIRVYAHLNDAVEGAFPEAVAAMIASMAPYVTDGGQLGPLYRRDPRAVKVLALAAAEPHLANLVGAA